jgi:hemerythrin
MKLIEWSDALSVGMDEIDEQHKSLVDLVNRYHSAVITGQDKDVLSSVLDELIDYTQIHFSLEEQLMQKGNYPDFKNHKKRHEELLEQVLAFRVRVAEGDEGVTNELWGFLRRWLTQHIQNSDLQYASYLRNNTEARTEIKLSWFQRIRQAVQHA